MKLLKYFILALMLGLQTETRAQTSDLEAFLGKLRLYADTHQANTKRTMPVIKPVDDQAQMPSPDIVGYMEDPETGLWYFPRTGKVYDPETSFAFDIRTGKIYKGKAEIKLEKYQNI